MGKQHQTFTNEPQEMPEQTPAPEIKQPTDPQQPEVPQEAPDEVPPEISPDDSPVTTG